MKIHCQYSKMVSPKDLKPHPKNRNLHPSAQIDRLIKILEYQGWRYPIKVSNRSGFITSGHGRNIAALKMKLDLVPVSYQDYDSDEQEYADVQADNAIASWSELDLKLINNDIGDLGPDFDIDLLGIKDFTLDISEKGFCDENEIPDKVEPKTKLGDIYKLGNHRLMCGDSTQIYAVEKLMNGEKTDMVFTDPPYGISIVKSDTIGISARVGFVSPRNAPSPFAKARKYKVIEGDDKEFDPTHILNMSAKTKIMWGANHYASKLPDHPQWLVWDKKLESGGLDANNFSDCELAWTNSDKLSTKIYRHIWAGMLRTGDRKEELKDRIHPTQKPVGLCEQIIKDFSKDKETILDIYGGSGSTLIACEKTNRKCFMMEIDPHYCDVIVARWEKYTGQKAELING